MKVSQASASGSPGDGGMPAMAAVDIQALLDEVREDAVLPHPVRMRDMLLRTKLDPDRALALNREFQQYLAQYGQAQQLAVKLLEQLAQEEPKEK
jgi:hypothetical protein